jgi:hypothetical protein
LKKEIVRLRTFVNWKFSPTPAFLAKAGFFYFQQKMETQCVFCFGVVKTWGASEDPFVVHQNKFPTCPFISNPSATDNIPLVPLPGEIILFFGS